MAYTLPPLVNGKSNEWADIAVIILGQVFRAVTKINYNVSREMKNVYGAGAGPVSRIYGQINPEASITILMEELENIISIIPSGNLQDIPEFPIIVTYTDPSLPPRVHTLEYCRFMDNPRASERGSGEIECECKLVIGNVKYK